VFSVHFLFCLKERNFLKDEKRMKTDVSVPEVGESVTQGVLTAWLKKDGEYVSEGEDLFELETDKATLAIPSPTSGILTIISAEGSEVNIGQIVAEMESEKKPEEKFPLETHQSVTSEKIIEVEEKPVSPEKTHSDVEKEKNLLLSPAVRRLVKEYNLDPEMIAGTGKGGRLTKKDVLDAIENQKITAKPPPVTAEKPAMEEQLQDKRLTASERQTRIKMTTIRRRTAERLVQAQHTAAFLTTFNEINMAKIIKIRAQYRESFENKYHVKLGFMSFFVKACCSALEVFPKINAQIQEDEIVYNNFYNIGIAVSTDRGLLVPVIRDADKLRYAEIELSIRTFAEKARNKKLTIDELSGGTFTITNGGVFGSLLSTPIPNPPQTAILGMHTIQERPIAFNQEVVIQPMMYVALTYDHRLIDGKEAVSFLVKVKQLIEDPQRLLLDL
jgi:2-oxoglutarate dehydrogenase E2 component (dihydrolipoamide succinyltransferase)